MTIVAVGGKLRRHCRRAATVLRPRATDLDQSNNSKFRHHGTAISKVNSDKCVVYHYMTNRQHREALLSTTGSVPPDCHRLT